MSQQPDEELREPRPPLSRRSAVILVVALLAAVAVGVSLRLTRQHEPRGSRIAATPGPEVAAATPSLPVAAATDALVPGQTTYIAATGGAITRSAQLINEATVPLTLDGPIQLLGPDRQPVASMSAKLVADRKRTALSELEAEPPLQTVNAHQRVALIVSGRFDCRTAVVESRWSARYPTIVIPIAGFDAPWSKSFRFLFSERWLAGVGPLGACRLAG